MTDIVSPERRSQIMGCVKSKNTAPELVVRRLAHRLGYRFRLHRKDLPGSPDLIFPRHAKAILVHGCFWHGHERCRRGALPKSRIEYWTEKISSNKERDQRKLAELEEAGWEVLVVWECETRNTEALFERIERFMNRGATGRQQCIK